MSDFIIAPCDKPDGNCKKQGIVCKETTNTLRFGLCDDGADLRLPARIDKADEDIWQLTVENPQTKEITFKAVDFCVDIYRSGDELIKRCEGFLLYESKICFVELKSGLHRGWLSDARKKFEETITAFKQHHSDCTFEFLSPIIANSSSYKTPQNIMIEQQKLKDAVGLEFQLRSTITIL